MIRVAAQFAVLLAVFGKRYAGVGTAEHGEIAERVLDAWEAFATAPGVPQPTEQDEWDDDEA